MSLDVSREIQAEGIHAWIVTDTFAIGAYRASAGRDADEHDVVEEQYCFGLGDVPCEVTVEGEGSARAGPDLIRFHKPGDRLVQRKAPEDGWSQNWIVVSEDLLEALLRGDFPPSFLRAPLPQLAALRSFLRRVERSECPVWIEETLTTVLDELLQQREHTARPRAATARQRDLALQADELLAQQFFRPLRLEQIARQLGVTAPYLARSYRSTLGSRMHERLMSLRLAAALSRLSDGAADLTSLALDLGFASHSHFTAAFRRRVGIPPSSFRAGCLK
jgi:AraC-like DNA-binding protein